MKTGEVRGKSSILHYPFHTAGCLFFLALLVLTSCGKKGPPTLKAYEKPERPTGLTAIHREDKIILSWAYPGNLRTAIKGFQVLRSEGDGFEKRAFLKNDQSVYVDEAFGLNSAYRYKVVAQNLMDVLSSDSEVIAVSPKPIPPPPDDLRIELRPDSVELFWKSSGENVCYNIYKTTEKDKYGDVPFNREIRCGTSFEDSSLSTERSVYYTVRALLNTQIKDEGYPSKQVEVNPSQFVPSSPADIRAVRTDDKIYLMWRENPEPWVKGYRVYRKREGEKDFSFLIEVKIPAAVDTERNGKRRWYMIKAVGPSSESEPATVEVGK